MGLLNLLVQIGSVIAGIYIAYADSFARGAMLVVVVGVTHIVVSTLNKAALAVHDKWLPEDQRMQMAWAARMGVTDESIIPRGWTIITNISAVLFLILASAEIWWFTSPVMR